MKQKIYVHALIKHSGKILLLRHAQSSDFGLKDKYDLPGGELAFGQRPDHAIETYISDAIGQNATAIQLMDIYSQMQGQQQSLFVVYLATISNNAIIQLSSNYNKYVWILMQHIQQNQLSESATYLLMQQKTIVGPTVSDEVKGAIDVKSSSIKHAIIYCDGGSRGNPGPSAAGFVIKDADERLVEEGGAYLGITTNNQAEYQAVLLALEAAFKQSVGTIEFRIDSLLVVNQMTGVYKIKNRDLWPIHERIKQLIGHFREVTFRHIRRELNQEADGMVNKILDEHSKEF